MRVSMTRGLIHPMFVYLPASIVNDILRINELAWLSNGKDSSTA